MILTIVQILRLRVVSPTHNGKLDLLEALSLEACPLLKAFLCVGELFSLDVVSKAQIYMQ
jgi:hypothetical protein